MIISRTPLRVSFVGGGSDLPEFYQREYGQVVSMAIDKYVYVAVKRQSDIVEHKFRLNWSKVEFVNDIEEIEHPIVRNAFQLFGIDFPCEVTTFSDIPGQTGLGSSSSFTVGLLHTLYALKSQMRSKADLAREASEMEIDRLNRTMGKQDHYAAAYGGINKITFSENGETDVVNLIWREKEKTDVLDSLMLFHTGKYRDASEILTSQVKEIDNKFDTIRKMRDLCPNFVDSIVGGDIYKVGELLKENWELKRGISSKISTKEIDNWYRNALLAGALGGKLLGAGGGGFLLFVVELEKQRNVAEALSELTLVKFGLDPFGTKIVYYDQ